MSLELNGRRITPTETSNLISHLWNRTTSGELVLRDMVPSQWHDPVIGFCLSKGMLNLALRGTDPVVYFESQRIYDIGEMFVPGPGAVEVHLRLGPGAQWVAESVPVRAVGRASDGSVTDVVLDVSGLAWFERLLLQLGPDARVLQPPQWIGLAAEAARRVLARYGEHV